jgi:hypothetical protein
MEPWQGQVRGNRARGRRLGMAPAERSEDGVTLCENIF